MTIEPDAAQAYVHRVVTQATAPASRAGRVWSPPLRRATGGAPQEPRGRVHALRDSRWRRLVAAAARPSGVAATPRRDATPRGSAAGWCADSRRAADESAPGSRAQRCRATARGGLHHGRRWLAPSVRVTRGAAQLRIGVAELAFTEQTQPRVTSAAPAGCLRHKEHRRRAARAQVREQVRAPDAGRFGSGIVAVALTVLIEG